MSYVFCSFDYYYYDFDDKSLKLHSNCLKQFVDLSYRYFDNILCLCVRDGKTFSHYYVENVSPDLYMQILEYVSQCVESCSIIQFGIFNIKFVDDLI